MKNTKQDNREIKIKRLCDEGERLYDNFIENLFKKNRVDIELPNPTTNTLELFALLNKKMDKMYLISKMCLELANNVDNEFFAESGELFENITIRKKISKSL